MIELLRAAAVTAPTRPAVLVGPECWTYPMLVRRAEHIAARLSALGIDRFAVVEADAALVISLLAGAALAGAEACQYQADTPVDEVAALRDRFDHHTVLTRRADLLIAPAALDLDDLSDGVEATAPALPSPPGPQRVMILTTGTTGAPKGLLHDWRRLLRPVEQAIAAPDKRWLLAYGPHQFAGYQVIGYVVAAAATLVAPFPRQPKDGLQAIRRHAVTHVSATPTYWRFLLAELDAAQLPAPELEQITLGGEAVPDSLLERLTQTFPNARISHVYAASEFGSTGTTRDRRGGLPVSVLTRGDDAATQFKVVDGELWIRSQVGMIAVHDAADIDPDDWRPTGDLVAIVDDRIVFRGRVSEIINVGGVKVHPLPVEEIVNRVPGVSLARVYARPSPLTGSIVAVEVVPSGSAGTDTLPDRIRAACGNLPRPWQPRSIRVVDEITTVGGKLRRSEPT